VTVTALEAAIGEVSEPESYRRRWPELILSFDVLISDPLGCRDQEPKEVLE
jgi:hypothetical protein